MLYTDFCDSILFDPIKAGANQLKIIAGYATHTMASWHITEIASRLHCKININLIVGMCQYDGINIAIHNGFKELMSRKNNLDQSSFICQYVTDCAPVHSKLYLWEKDDDPICAFMGSSNYTQTAFSASRKELMCDCSAKDAQKYFDDIESKTTYCNHAEIEDKIRLNPIDKILIEEKSQRISMRGSGVLSQKLSLLTNTGDVGYGSGINWGHRKNGSRRELNQAYISLPSQISKTGFFPLGKKHFSVLTDDGKQLILRVEQQNDKAITTPLNNSLLGEYLRARIGLPNGSFIKKEDLKNYGRTDITFYKLDEEQFFMDFSV